MGSIKMKLSSLYVCAYIYIYIFIYIFEGQVTWCLSFA